MGLRVFLLGFFLIFFLNSKTFASFDDYFPYKVGPTSANYGNTGLLETPNARFMEPGALRFSFSSSYPLEFTSLTATPFSWMEATYRYTEIKNDNYGPSSYSRNQSDKDKAFDLKIRLLREGYILPEFAMGLRDAGGTGKFASEYLVATKGVGSLDLTLGIATGGMGSDDNIKNPFTDISDRFKVRNNDSDTQGGGLNINSLFTGKAALFGGLEYSLKRYGLKFMLEYDTSNPEREPSRDMKVQSRFNAGIKYFLSDTLNFGVAFERGHQFRLSFSLKGLFEKDTLTKPKPKNVIALSNKQMESFKDNKDLFYRSLNKSLRDESIFLQAASYNDDSVDLAIASNRFSSFPRAAGRSARIVSALTPQEITKINVHSMNGDLEVAIFTLDRLEYDQAANYVGSPSEVLSNSKISSKSNKPLFLEADFKPTVNFPEFTWSLSPSLKHQIGGPEGFYLGALSLKLDSSIKFRRNLTFYTSLDFNVYDTFSEFNNPSQSKIPHVRSDIQDYLKEGKNSIQRMQLEYIFSPYNDVFVKLDLGYLEEMFGGFGGEILYRPFSNDSVFGLTTYKVKQRSFDQRFSFKEYTASTVHLSYYQDFIYGISGHFSVGKYLAGDKGGTVDLSRRFKSGFTLGVFATKTNLSKEMFGEGSFDKGFYFSIPVNLFYSDFKTGNISFGLHPLTKDGGAFLNRPHALFGILGDTKKSTLLRDWDDLLD